MRLRFPAQEVVFLDQVDGQLSEPISIFVAVKNRTQDYAKPSVTICRSGRCPVFDTYAHHVAEEEAEQIVIDMECRSKQCRQRTHCRLHLRVAHPGKLYQA